MSKKNETKETKTAAKKAAEKEARISARIEKLEPRAYSLDEAFEIFEVEN